MTRRYKPENWAALEVFGKALLHFAETGDASKLRKSAIPVAAVAKGIIEIARGEDARKVFGQDPGRGNSDMDAENKARAYVYWLARVDEPENVDRAVELAQKQYSYLPPPSRASIMRIARNYRDMMLDLFDRAGEGREIQGRSKIDTSALRQYLEKKSRRGRF